MLHPAHVLHKDDRLNRSPHLKPSRLLALLASRQFVSCGVFFSVRGRSQVEGGKGSGSKQARDEEGAREWRGGSGGER